jgi:hypothetical protein
MKSVLVAIARHTNSKNEDHKAWPSLDTLEVETQHGRAAISRAIDGLQKVGAFLSYMPGGGRQYSTYVLEPVSYMPQQEV